VSFPFEAFFAGWSDDPLSTLDAAWPWELTQNAETTLRAQIARLGEGWRREGEAAIHESALIEPGAILKGPALIGPGARVGAHAILRGGVRLSEGAVVGPGCEVKSSFLLAKARIAHLSFCGDSILGAGVNIEAGAIIANHRNERATGEVFVRSSKGRIATGGKFGACVGDHARIGANAVLSPGTILPADAIVARLALVEQDPD
jgi:NDP-sugar pyrophosphorylase family protein